MSCLDSVSNDKIRRPQHPHFNVIMSTKSSRTRVRIYIKKVKENIPSAIPLFSLDYLLVAI